MSAQGLPDDTLIAKAPPSQKEGIKAADGTEIIFDVMETTDHVLSADVPSHSVEDGAEISHVVHPQTDSWTATGIITRTPLVEDLDFVLQGRDIVNKAAVRDIFFEGKLVTYLTPTAVYEDVAIEEVRHPNDTAEQHIELSLSLKRVDITNSQNVQIDPDQLSELVSSTASDEADRGRQAKQEPNTEQEEAGEEVKEKTEGEEQSYAKSLFG